MVTVVKIEIFKNKSLILPAIGINVTGSCVQAFSSIIMCEKCFGSKSGSTPLARTKHPEVSNVQTMTRNSYKCRSGGN